MLPGYITAVEVVAEVLDSAQALVDARFGEGFAKSNPALLGAVVQAVVMERQGSACGSELRDVFLAIGDQLK